MENKIKDFLQALDLVKRPPNDLCDHGLILKNENSAYSLAEIIDMVKEQKNNIDYISYDNENYDEKIIELLLQSFNKGNWVFLHLKKNLGALLIRQLKSLLNNGELQEVKYGEKSFYSVKQPAACRIIVLADRNFVEKEMDYKDFYSFFGPILSVE